MKSKPKKLAVSDLSYKIARHVIDLSEAWPTTVSKDIHTVARQVEYIIQEDSNESNKA